jgi:hypothetical protein
LQGKQVVRKVSVVIVALLALTGLAGAQVPKGNIFFGYSYARADIGAMDRANLNGWNGSLEGKLFPFLGIVADVSGHYGSQNFGAVCGTAGSCVISGDGRGLTALFGPRVSVSVGKIRRFAEAMFGVSHLKLDFPGFSSTDTSFASAYGGGIDYHLLPMLSWR